MWELVLLKVQKKNFRCLFLFSPFFCVFFSLLTFLLFQAFFVEAGETALVKGVVVDIISIIGSECSLDTLSIVSEATGLCSSFFFSEKGKS